MLQNFVVGEPVVVINWYFKSYQQQPRGTITSIGEPFLLHGIACVSITLDDNLTVQCSNQHQRKTNKIKKEIGFF